MAAHPTTEGSTICIDAVTELPGAAASVRTARRWISDRLLCWFPGQDELADDLVVVVSELVSNSVAAGAARVSVALEAHTRGVDVAVADDAPGLPRAGTAATRDTSGRGLGIVQALSASWEVVAERGGCGKTVRATLVAPVGGRLGFDCAA